MWTHLNPHIYIVPCFHGFENQLKTRTGDQTCHLTNRVSTQNQIEPNSVNRFSKTNKITVFFPVENSPCFPPKQPEKTVNQSQIPHERSDWQIRIRTSKIRASSYRLDTKPIQVPSRAPCFSYFSGLIPRPIQLTSLTGYNLQDRTFQFLKLLFPLIHLICPCNTFYMA